MTQHWDAWDISGIAVCLVFISVYVLHLVSKAVRTPSPPGVRLTERQAAHITARSCICDTHGRPIESAHLHDYACPKRGDPNS